MLSGVVEVDPNRHQLLSERALTLVANEPYGEISVVDVSEAPGLDFIDNLPERRRRRRRFACKGEWRYRSQSSHGDRNISHDLTSGRSLWATARRSGTPFEWAWRGGDLDGEWIIPVKTALFFFNSVE
jgi:hypothetical protein